FADAVAQTALAGLLALVRGVDRLARLQAQRRWDCAAIRGSIRTLSGADVVVMGYGGIGRRFPELLAPFGCRVPRFAPPAPEAELKNVAALDAALPQADVVFAALPEHPDTVGLLCAQRLRRLKPTAIVVNVGRGSVLDEAALVELLRRDELGGAVLDVTAQEPLPADHPLWGLPNVVLTQHTAGGECDEIDRKIAFFTDNCRRYRDGLPLRSQIDWSKGY